MSAKKKVNDFLSEAILWNNNLNVTDLYEMGKKYRHGWTQTQLDRYWPMVYEKFKRDMGIAFLRFYKIRGFLPTSMEAVLTHAIRNHDRELVLWAQDPVKKIPNFVIRWADSERNTLYHLSWLYDEFQILPICLIRNKIFSNIRYWKTNFGLILEMSQDKVQQHLKILNICLAMAPLRLPSYVLLEIIEFVTGNKLTHGEKIAHIIYINEGYRKRRQ